MKKTISAVSLILLLVAVFATPADASTGFALTDGVVEGCINEEGCNSLRINNFWNTIRIDVVPGEYVLYSYTTEAEGVASDEFGGNVPYNGKIEGSFNPENGYFHGKFYINWKFEGQGWRYKGSFEKYLQPGENPVTLEVTNNEFAMQFHDGSYRDTLMEKFKYSVTFNVEGKIELNVPAPTSPFPDSGARFSDFSGQVEVLIPKGYKADGEPDWDEETWTIAKLDMTLPEGTRIKTSERSTVILSFADLTTFTMKPETEIILSKPQANPGLLKLLGGQLWINFKRMIKDGSMEIEMGQAASGIKGTTLVLEDDGTTSTVKVIEGTVEFTAKADGKSRLVEAGSMLSADSTGLGEMQTFDIAAESASWPQVAGIDAGNASSAEPGEPDVVVVPYGTEAEELSPDAAEEPGPRIGLILGIYFAVAIVLMAAVVVIVLLTRRKKRT